MLLRKKTRNVSSCFCNIKTRQLQFIVGWAATILTIQGSTGAWCCLRSCTGYLLSNVLVLTWKALNALAPQYISDLLVQLCKPPWALRSSDEKLEQVPNFKLKAYGSRSFSYKVPYLWNQLSNAMRRSPSPATFKSIPKTYLFDQVLIFDPLVYLFNTRVFLVTIFSYLICLFVAVQRSVLQYGRYRSIVYYY